MEARGSVVVASQGTALPGRQRITGHGFGNPPPGFGSSGRRETVGRIASRLCGPTAPAICGRLAASRRPRREQSEWVAGGPRGALLFALDLDYQPDPKDRVFQFGPPREADFRFPLPAYVSPIAEVLRVDADGVAPVDYKASAGAVEVRDRVSRVAVYVVATQPGKWARLEARRQALVAQENTFGFDPGKNPADLAALQELARKK